MRCACGQAVRCSVLAFVISALPLAGWSAQVNYHLIRRVVLGGSGGWDYLKVDTAARRLYISRGDRVLVVNADTFQQVGEIPNTQGVHCVDIAPDLERGFASDGEASAVTFFDRRTLKVIEVVKTTGQGPDALVYDPASERVFTFNGRSGNSTVIDAQERKSAGYDRSGRAAGICGVRSEGDDL